MTEPGHRVSSCSQAVHHHLRHPQAPVRSDTTSLQRADRGTALSPQLREPIIHNNLRHTTEIRIPPLRKHLPIHPQYPLSCLPLPQTVTPGSGQARSPGQPLRLEGPQILNGRGTEGRATFPHSPGGKSTQLVGKVRQPGSPSVEGQGSTCPPLFAGFRENRQRRHTVTLEMAALKIFRL